LALLVFFWQKGDIEMASMFFAAGTAYAVISVTEFQGKRWARQLSLIPPVLSLLFLGPGVIYNFYAFLTNDPLYLDSPGTILVVGITAIIFLVPALVILFLRSILPH
jgi:hypothetical protein